MRAELQKIFQREVGEQGQHGPQKFLGPGRHFPEKLRGQQALCKSLLLFRLHSWTVIPDGSQAGESNGSQPLALFQTVFPGFSAALQSWAGRRLSLILTERISERGCPRLVGSA